HSVRHSSGEQSPQCGILPVSLGGGGALPTRPTHPAESLHLLTPPTHPTDFASDPEPLTWWQRLRVLAHLEVELALRTAGARHAEARTRGDFFAYLHVETGEPRCHGK